MPRIVPTSKVTWRAGSDRIAHAHTHGRTRSLCGQPVLEERFAWTKFRDCMECAAAAERLDAVPETEQRLLAGDR